MKRVVITLVCLTLCMATGSLLWAAGGIEFPGTVITVDSTAGKVAVKKDGGGTRFTFTTNEQTQFQGTSLTSLKDLKKDDKVVVVYQMQGSQYVALSISRQK